MNKISNINLGGFPFTIDEDAYSYLDKYLKTIHRHFQDSDGYDEITNDIEARLAELFREKLENRPIVTLLDVKNVIAIMGTPEDFGAAESFEEEAPKSTSGHADRHSGKFKIKTGKRLFRDPEREAVAGVCAGIAAYFGIQDPLWVRLAFILFVLTGGFAVIAYLVLWAIVPKAETAGDRLAMRGEPANVENIGRIIEEELEHVSKKVSELGEELKTEFASKKKTFDKTYSEEFGTAKDNLSDNVRSAATKGVHVLSSIINALLQIAKGAVHLVLKIVRPILSIIGIFLIAMLVIFWISVVVGCFLSMPMLGYVSAGSQFATTLGIFNILFVVGIPLLMLAMLFMRLFLRSNFRPKWQLGLWLFWLVNLVCLCFTATLFVKDIQFVEEAGITKNAYTVPSDTLTVEMAPPPSKRSFISFGDHIFLSDNHLIVRSVKVNFEKSPSNQLEVSVQPESRGGSFDHAKNLAQAIQYDYQLEGNKLILPSHFTIEKGNKWRNQQVVVTVFVPEGMYVTRNHEMARHTNWVKQDESQQFPGYWHLDQIWKMGPNGMTAPEYSPEQKTEFNFHGFSKIQVEGDIELDIKQANHFGVKLTGSDSSEGLEVSKNGDKLMLIGTDDYHGDFHLEISMPNLTEIWAIRSNDIQLRGFTLDELHIVNEGSGSINAFADIKKLDIHLTGDNQIELRGNGERLDAILSDRAELDAEHFTVKNANLELDNSSLAKVSATDTLWRKTSADSEIISRRTPIVIEKTSGSN